MLWMIFLNKILAPVFFFTFKLTQSVHEGLYVKKNQLNIIGVCNISDLTTLLFAVEKHVEWLHWSRKEAYEVDKNTALTKIQYYEMHQLTLV